MGLRLAVKMDYDSATCVIRFFRASFGHITAVLITPRSTPPLKRVHPAAALEREDLVPGLLERVQGRHPLAVLGIAVRAQATVLSEQLLVLLLQLAVVELLRLERVHLFVQVVGLLLELVDALLHVVVLALQRLGLGLRLVALLLQGLHLRDVFVVRLVQEDARPGGKHVRRLLLHLLAVLRQLGLPLRSRRRLERFEFLDLGLALLELLGLGPDGGSRRCLGGFELLRLGLELSDLGLERLELRFDLLGGDVKG